MSGPGRATAAALALALGAVGCSSGSSPSAGSTAAVSSPASATSGSTTAPGPAAGALAYTEPGLYPVGFLELETPNGTTSVWYPGEPGQEAGRAKASYDLRAFLPDAERAKVASVEAAVHEMDAFPDLPRADTVEPFPLVLFSHGFCGYRQQSAFLTTAIASQGFVVAAPEHLSRDLTACVKGTIGQAPTGDVEDLQAEIPIMEAQNLSEDGALATIVDTTKVAVVGHSAGGVAAIRMSGDPHVLAYVALAAGGGTIGSAVTPAAKPALYIAGGADAIAPVAAIEQWWSTAVPAPKRLAVLGGVTHLAFMDICTLAPDQGGILEGFRAAGGTVPEVIAHLFADGCDPSHTPATAAWPAIEHLVIAHLRAALGLDPAPVALDPSISTAYPGLTVDFRSA